MVTPRPLGNDVPVYRPARDDAGRPAPPSFASPTDTMSLRDAIQLALLHSPQLAAAGWEVRARDARAAQAGRLPNPTISGLAEDFGATRIAGGPAGQPIQRQTTLQLSQLVELGGKRSARRRVATRERELAEWDFEATRMDVLTGVTHAFVDLLVAQEMVALTRQADELVARVQQSVGARVVAGVVSPIEETKAEVSRASVRVELQRAQRLLEASRQRLAALWGRTEATFPGVRGDLNAIADIPPIEELRARLSQSAEMARWAVEVSRRRAALSAERSKRIPDVTVSGGQRRFTDLDNSAYLVGVSLPLPLFDHNGAAVAEARNRLNKSFEERRAAETRVSVQLADAYRALASAHEEVTTLRQTVLPGSRQTFEAVTEGYRLGKFGYLDVLDAQRTLIGAGSQYLRAVSEYHKAVADVERLIGAPLRDGP